MNPFGLVVNLEYRSFTESPRVQDPGMAIAFIHGQRRGG